MKSVKAWPALDSFRLLAVLLVVVNHTSPLADCTVAGDFWLTRVLARVAVPFFLMTSGYFLSPNGWHGTRRQLKKLCLLYGISVLLYLPLNLYNGGFDGPLDFLKKLLIDGTFYHLWYFPAAILGILTARQLSCLGPRAALIAAGGLYLVGLGGDSYYGLAAQVPMLKVFYDGFFTVCSHTRNGLFYAPLFLLLGAAGRTWSRRISVPGLGLSLLAMSAEGLSPRPGRPAARQHVSPPAAVHGLSVFPAAGYQPGTAAGAADLFRAGVPPPSLVHRAGAGRRQGGGAGEAAD